MTSKNSSLKTKIAPASSATAAANQATTKNLKQPHFAVFHDQSHRHKQKDTKTGASD